MHQAGKLSEGLRALGAETVEVPVLEIRPPASFEPLDASLNGLGSYDWLILTSANTVRAVAARAAETGTNLAQPAGLKVAAVGESTAEAAREAGWKVSFIPGTYVAESLSEGLLQHENGRGTGLRVLLARAATARDVIPAALRDAGAEVDVVDAYRNALPEAAPERLLDALRERIDAAMFTSSSSVTHLAQTARRAGIAWPIAGAAAVSIGPITSGTLRELGWEPATEAKVSDSSGLVAAAVAFFGR
jgi:uroporphyrinogen-III synthase/uroporphyrinogen III methyltransferase/synthase